MEAAIQFTVEEEVDGKLPFLDMLIERKGPTLSFAVYRKPTHTGRYLHFGSLQPASHKRAVVSTLLRRAEKICTRQEDYAADVSVVRRELSACGYPCSFLNAVERQMARPQLPHAASSQKRAGIPYIPSTSEALSRILRSYNVQVAHIPNQKLRQSLVNVKDKLPKEKFPGVVYVVPCADCDYVYIGETGDFERRLKQHNYDVKKENVKSSALAEHATSSGHAIDWGKARVLAREKGLSRRFILSPS